MASARLSPGPVKNGSGSVSLPGGTPRHGGAPIQRRQARSGKLVERLPPTLPGHPWASSYELVLDTATSGYGEGFHDPGSEVWLVSRSVRLYRAVR